jgi:hypothetical protein
MSTEQKREKLVMHYKVLSTLALGAVARLTDRTQCTTQLDMMKISNSVNQRLEVRIKLIDQVWIQQELPLG